MTRWSALFYRYTCRNLTGFHRFRLMTRSSREVIARPLAFATGAACLATVLAYGSRWLWACELLVNFRTHLALLLSLALLGAVPLRRWRIATAAAMGIALNAWPM